MLQVISSDHDPHTLRSHSHSVDSLTAARSDGKLHLLLAASTYCCFPLSTHPDDMYISLYTIPRRLTLPKPNPQPAP